MSLNILFISEDTFKRLTPISDAVDFKQVTAFIKIAQDIYIQPVVGSGLYTRLQAGIDSSNLNNDEVVLLNNYITDALVWYTMSMLPMGMGYQLFSKGFLQKTSEDSDTPSRGTLELLSEEYKKIAEFYNTRMIKYLQANYNLHSTYLNPGSGCDVIFPNKKAYTSPIYLGPDCSCDGGGAWSNGSGGGTGPVTFEYTSPGNEATFVIPVLAGRTVLAATRAGFSKGITPNPTADTQYLQILGSQVTLPTGDSTVAGELFTFIYR